MKVKISQYSILIITIYITVLAVQWTYEDKYTHASLLKDIVEYDTQIVTESEKDKRNLDQYYDIFIEVENINLTVWFYKWNIFDWNESKYILGNNKNKILENLNYWRQTGKLPTFYNLNIKSV